MVELTDALVAQSPAFQRAYLASFPYNLVRSGNLSEYYQTLTDFDFLEAKINHPGFGVQALIEDYDLIDDPPQPPLKRGENQPPQILLERREEEPPQPPLLSYALLTSFLIKSGLTEVVVVGESSNQVCVMSCSRRRPCQIVFTPGSPSCLRPKNPPS